MATAAHQIESKAMKLSSRERARLAERLIASLDDEVTLTPKPRGFGKASADWTSSVRGR